MLGDLDPNNADGGNMKKIKFYVCPTCGNIITSIGEAELSCCGRKLIALVAKPSNENHNLKVETIEDDYYITFLHEMSKEHYINFIAYVACDRILMVRLYPEQSSEVRVILIFFLLLLHGYLLLILIFHDIYYNDNYTKH